MRRMPNDRREGAFLRAQSTFCSLLARRPTMELVMFALFSRSHLQMGFERAACVRAAVATNNDAESAAAWLLASTAEAEAEAEVVGLDAGDASSSRRPLHSGAGGSGVAVVLTGGGEAWDLVGGSPESPLSVLSGVDHFNIHDTVCIRCRTLLPPTLRSSPRSL
jgi:hypothetical protein